MTTQMLLQNAKAAKKDIAFADTDAKNKLLTAIAQELELCTDEILSANAVDIENAKATVSSVMLDRLSLTKERIAAMAQGVRQVAALPDPIGEVISSEKRPNGLMIDKVRVPLGVVAIIYESRPNVTSDAAALALKSGNACVLRGGKEAFNSNKAIVNTMKNAAVKCGLSPDIITFITDTTRQSAAELMQARGFIDLLIPRGGAGLIRACVENAKVPCIETGTGICHIYVDGSANLDMALKIVINAKTSRPSVCNAAEVCLINKSIAEKFLPMLKAAMDERHTTLRLCENSIKIIDGEKAGEADFDTEFLDYILAVKIVEDLSKAIEHINAHSTGHSESIITADSAAAQDFCTKIDSAAVYVNASTRFTDGGEFGLGCEMGIATQKLGARGPMGLKEITSYKYLIHGNGHIR